jgi:abhydrolase domain-containing protein 12
MSEPKRASPPPKGRFYKRARAVLIGLASLYALAVLLVMTPVIQTQFRYIPFLYYRRCLWLPSFLPSSVLYAHHIDFWWYNKFDHPENYGLARELLLIPSIQR